MTREKFIEVCCEVCEDNDGWYVAIDGDCVEIRKPFREGKEFSSFIYFDGRRDPLEQMQYEYNDFNADECAARWYEQNKNGPSSASLQNWLDFAEEVEYMLEQLWNSLAYAASEEKRRNNGENA